MPIDLTDLALFNAATVVIVRNGHKTSFWCSSWINGQTPSTICQLLYKHSRRKNRSVRHAIINGSWIRDIAYNLNHDLLNEFFKLWRAIDALHLDFNDTREDHIVWTLESFGEYSTKSAYVIQTNTLGLPFSYMESLGTTQIQVLCMATSSGQAMDDGSSAATWLEKQLLLCIV